MIKRHHFGTAMPSGGVHPINYGSHKANAVRRAIRACRRQALLPAEILARSLRQVQTLAPQSRKV